VSGKWVSTPDDLPINAENCLRVFPSKAGIESLQGVANLLGTGFHL